MLYLIERLELKQVAISLFNTCLVAFLEAVQVLVLPVYQELLATVGLYSSLDCKLYIFLSIADFIKHQFTSRLGQSVLPVLHEILAHCQSSHRPPT